MTTDSTDPLQRFERARLDVFRAHGLDGRSRRISGHTGRETYAIVCGDGPRQTVLVHGGLGDASEWALVAGRLAGPLVIPDRPGYGLTYRVDYRKVDFRRDAAGWMLDLVEGLDAEKIDLVGASMGGFFAMAFATAHPQPGWGNFAPGPALPLSPDDRMAVAGWMLSNFQQEKNAREAAGK